MKLLKNEKTEQNTCEIEINLDAASFKDAIDRAYKSTASKYNMHGFRKGKAPRALIEKTYGADVFYYDAINDLMPSAYDEVLKETKIEPVDRPMVDILSADLENGATIKIVVTVKPEVELGKYKGLKATKTVKTVSDDEVNAEIDKMVERNARTITREDAAQDGDITDIDFEGFVDGVAFDGGKGEHFSLTLGSGQFIPGFEDQVVGHKAGEEFDVNVKFPKEYQAADLADKDAVFKVKLHEVKCKELPVIDDEFAKDVSEYDTIEELKNSIRENAKNNNERQAELDVENSLVEQVVETLKADIPAIMIENRIDEMVRDFEAQLRQQGLKLEDYLKYMGGEETKFRDGFKEQAEKQVKTRLALEKIVSLEGIVASDEDFEKEVERIASAYKIEAEKVKSFVPEEDIKSDLAVNKAIDLLKENAKITEKEEKEEKKPAKKTAKKTEKKEDK